MNVKIRRAKYVCAIEEVCRARRRAGDYRKTTSHSRVARQKKKYISGSRLK